MWFCDSRPEHKSLKTQASIYMTHKPILKFVGLGLLIAGTILNLLMFIFQVWPTYIFFIMMAVGLVFVLFSFLFRNIKTAWQIIIVLIPFLVTYLLFNISSPSKDIFLIPKGFTGQVTIYYDRPNGQKEEHEGNWRIYKIPQNGILETKFRLKGNSIDLSGAKYYYVDSTGKRIELKHYCNYCEIKDTVSIQVIYGVVGAGNNGTYQTFNIDSPSKESAKK